MKSAEEYLHSDIGDDAPISEAERLLIGQYRRLRRAEESTGNYHAFSGTDRLMDLVLWYLQSPSAAFRNQKKKTKKLIRRIAKWIAQERES